MNLSFHFSESKPSQRAFRRAYRRRVVTAAKANLLLNILGHTGFLTSQQVYVLIALLGVAR